MARVAPVIQLTELQRSELERLVRPTISSRSQILRARIVLFAAQGNPSDEIASTLKVPEQTVGKWRRRFGRQGMKRLEDSPRSGRPLHLDIAKINCVLTEVTKPLGSRSQWSIRSMARHAGFYKSHAQWLWSRNDIKPHVRRTFK